MNEDRKELFRFFVFGIIIVSALIFLFSLEGVPTPHAVLGPGEQVGVFRDLSDFSNGNTAFDVVLEVLTVENLTAIGITEQIQAGWVIGDCSVGNCVIDETTNVLEILLFSGIDDIDDQNITYTVTPNSDDGIFSGTWRSASVDLDGVVGGDVVLGGGCVDSDGDGYYAVSCGGDDCNDGNSSIHPGASDNNCNGIDDNCDGVVDDYTSDSDSDGDGVGDRCDLCPNSPFVNGVSINSRGCVLPRYNKFDSNTTAFSLFDNLISLQNLLLGVSGKGAIFFVDKVSLNVEGVDFDAYVDISTNSISLDVEALSFLKNESARLQFFNVHFNDPKIFRDGIECLSPDCNLTQNVGGILTYNISHFSTYTVSDAYIAPDTGSPGSSGGSSGGGSSGGGSVCVVDWVCGDWSICKSGKATRDCSDLASCNNESYRPLGVKDCECTEHWVCNPWEKDERGRDVRDCVDVNGCGTFYDRPDLMKELVDISSGYKKILYTISFIILIVIIFAIYLIVRKQDDSGDSLVESKKPVVSPRVSVDAGFFSKIKNKFSGGSSGGVVSFGNVGGDIAPVSSSATSVSGTNGVNPFKKNNSVDEGKKQYFS